MEIESKNFYTVIAKSKIAKGEFANIHVLGNTEQKAIKLWLDLNGNLYEWEECKDEWQVIKVSLENGREL